MKAAKTFNLFDSRLYGDLYSEIFRYKKIKLKRSSK